jgi:hypothetical protein
MNIIFSNQVFVEISKPNYAEELMASADANGNLALSNAAKEIQTTRNAFYTGLIITTLGALGLAISSYRAPFFALTSVGIGLSVLCVKNLYKISNYVVKELQWTQEFSLEF